MQLVARNPIDRYFLRGELQCAPWSIHAEVASEDRFDRRKLAGAIQSALCAHPMARANAECWIHGPWAIREGDSAPLTWAEASSSTELDGFRDEFISKPFSYAGNSLLVRFAVVRTPLQDHFLTVTHHAIIDGIGTLLLARAVLDAYSEDQPPSPQPDTSWSRVRSLPVPQHPRNQAALGNLRERVRRNCARVAADGGIAGETGWGFTHCSFRDPRNSASAIKGNDALLAAFHLAIDRWNTDHDVVSDDIGVALTVNLRPHSDWYSGLGNVSLAWPTRTRLSERTVPGSLIDVVARQAKECRFGIAGSAVATVAEDFVKRDGQVLWLKKALAETTVVSNMGDMSRALAENPLHINSMFGSMPPTASMPVSFYVGRWRDEVAIGGRFRRDRLDRRATTALIQSVFACYRELDAYANP